MTLAVGGLVDAVSGKELGTVFAVTGRLALTAFHCVGNHTSGCLQASRVRCIWTDGSSSNAVVEDGDRRRDVALLRLEAELPPSLDPVLLTKDAAKHAEFSAPGSPVQVPDVSIFTVSGQITSLNAALNGTRVLQLACHESAAELSLRGMSGAPVLVGQTQRAAGIMRWNPPREDRPELAVGGAVFATPSAAVVDRWPQLDPAHAADNADLRRILHRLTRRRPGREVAGIQLGIWRLLLAGGLGLESRDLKADLETPDTEHCRIGLKRGRTLIEIIGDLRDDGAVASAERRLRRILARHIDETGMRHLGILTDGTEWRLYHWVDGALMLVLPPLMVDPSSPDPRALLSWLEAILATARRIKPTPDEIRRKLGADSPAHKVDTAELRALYAKYRDQRTVQVKRAMWAKLLTTASGLNFADEDWLFVDHTLLVAMAEVVGHAHLGFRLDDPELTAERIMSGWHFTQRAQIRGVIESDFFDWVVHVPGGEQFIKELARRITRFSWADVAHDVMKVLYQSIIPGETRKQLGEYYTPDWLAEKIVADCVDDPLEQRVLDASCGSGTFLFHAVRRYVAAAAAAGRSASETICGLVDHVIGFDVHPVAVTLARVTYLLAMGSELLKPPGGRPEFTVPVYLGDSLRWGQETSLFSHDLSILTTLEHDAFLSDQNVTGRPEGRLVFPDRTVADAGLFDQLVTELADLATQRERFTPAPSLTETLERFGIVDQNDREMLSVTFKKMCDLHDDEKDHIWGYYVRNLARPAWLARLGNRVHVLVGNPPWLAYHIMTVPQQRSYREMSKKRRLWVGATVAPHQDLSALFVERCIEQYLREDGTFGYVMLRAVLMGQQYAGFRTGSYQREPETVAVVFGRPWDLCEIKPDFFRQSVGAVFGRRARSHLETMPLDQAPELWTGRFDAEFASWADAEPHITRTIPERRVLPAAGSPYRDQFRQGATVVPRFLFLVELEATNRLGTGDRQPVHSLRRPRENRRYKGAKPLDGSVERRFIRLLYLGDSIAPFHCLKPFPAVIPWDGYRLLGQDDNDLQRFPGLAKWWRDAEATWEQHRGPGNRLSLKQRLDYRHGLSQQFPAPAYRVVFNKSGMYLAAAVVRDPDAAVDHKLIWGTANTIDEARFLTAVLNSTPVVTEVAHLQGRGEHNPRDFDMHVFRLPIPRHDPENGVHRQLAELARRAEDVAAKVDLPKEVGFEAKRRRIRQALATDGVIAEIDAITELLLA